MKSAIVTPPETASRNALAVIATVAAGAAVYWLRDILTPLAMAIFLLIMIDGVKRTIEARTPLPRRWAGVAALALVVLAFFASIGIIVNGAAGFFGEASGVSQNIGPRIDQIIRDVYGLFHLVNPPTAQDLINSIDLRGYLASTAMQVQGIASSAFFVLVYLGFLLASQMGFQRKIVAMFPAKAHRDEAVAVFQRVRGGVEGYLWVQAVTGIMICAAAWLLMRAVGLQNAEFWTFVIFIVGFIPVLGGAVAGLAPPLFALVQFSSYWPAGDSAGGPADHPVRGRQLHPAAHAGRQSEHRPGGGSAGSGLLGQAVGRGRHVPVHAAGGHGHGRPGRVPGLALDGGAAVGRRRALCRQGPAQRREDAAETTPKARDQGRCRSRGLEPVRAASR